MMLNMSRDHQLFFKIYDDYSNITDSSGSSTPDLLNIPDTTFIHAYEYYGYFDSNKCYKYTSNRFEPNRETQSGAGNEHYCNYSGGTGEWSGNFLNWATMTRIDAVRKILYGGYRSTDTATETVLERAFLPNDAHSFAKFYDGNDIQKLTPFSASDAPQAINTAATGITICNTTAGAGYSQNTTAPPLMRVVKGNFSLWASNERWQCKWGSAANGNQAAASGINAYSFAPPDDNTYKLRIDSANAEYYVRVKVCVDATESLIVAATPTSQEQEGYGCKKYPTGTIAKPTGLLQKWGESGQLSFGLVTGSYGKNKSGGVLRKNVGTMLDEINTTTNGTFKSAPATGGIINTINLLRLYGYNHDSGIYNDASPGDNCEWGKSSFAEGTCSNWGNPQSEIYLESLRYLAGKTLATPAYNATDTTYFPGLTSAAWVAPVTSANYCAPLNVLQFNASTNSYDDNDVVNNANGYSSIADINSLLTTTAMNTNTNFIGTKEGVDSTSRFVGRLIGSAVSDDYQLCSAKSINSLSNVSGTCPDSPRLEGGYNMAGLANFARRTGISVNGVSGTSKVRTYGVALSPAVPKVEVTYAGKKVVIQPACRNKSTGTTETNCAIVDFKIVSQNTVSFSGRTGAESVLNNETGVEGKLYVNWEDSEQGGDYDQDMWGVITYFITASKVLVKTQVMAQSTPNKMGFGYVISGTNDDGFHVHSGINNFEYENASDGATCSLAVGNKCTCREDGGYGGCDSNNTPSAAAAAAAAARYGSYSFTTSSASFLRSPLYYAAKWGGFSKAFEDDVIKKGLNFDVELNKVDPSGDTYFFATDPKTLAKQLDKAIKQITDDTGTSSAVATNSSYLQQGSFVFQSEFNSANWSGKLSAYEFLGTGLLNTTPAAVTSDSGKMPTNGSGRNVYTYNGSSLIPFAFETLTPTQVTALTVGSDPAPSAVTCPTTWVECRVSWLRGDDTYESKGLRSRTSITGRNILGDLVNSSPVYVGALNQRYYNLPGTAGTSYRDYLEAKKLKTPMIYVGSNDGMVHAFNATGRLANGTISSNMLKEEFAYIPNIVFPKLAKLAAADYGKTTNAHQYIVDGPIVAGDVYIGGGWKTIIVGTLGAGGRGVYALDITDPSDPKVLFEFNNNSLPSAIFSKLGYVMNAPQIVPMKNGRWAVVFGNGDSSGTNGQLFIVDIESPFNTTYTKVIDTGYAYGLSGVELKADSTGQVVSAYAGDLGGNLIRFSLSSTSAGSWVKDYLMFSATDAGGNRQPIYAAPTLGINSSKGDVIMVYFGTGKYYDTADNTVPVTPIHSFYAIAEMGATVLRSSLQPKTMVTSYNATTPSLSTRTVTEPGTAFWATKNGWYLDFSSPIGERVTTTPLLIADKLVFPTLIPSASPCAYGGTSWLMEVVAIGDKYINEHVLPNNLFKDALILGELGIGLTADGAGRLVGVDSNSKTVNESITIPPRMLGRQSWRQIR
ncbi:MAG: PilC/PilY family type IV pilus protein [Pseudomonadota bacterium]